MSINLNVPIYQSITLPDDWQKCQTPQELSYWLIAQLQTLKLKVAENKSDIEALQNNPVTLYFNTATMHFNVVNQTVELVVTWYAKTATPSTYSSMKTFLMDYPIDAAVSATGVQFSSNNNLSYITRFENVDGAFKITNGNITTLYDEDEATNFTCSATSFKVI